MAHDTHFEGYAKKSLGQNFLTSVAALEKIIEAAKLTANDIVLEAGPGKGVLTEKLLQKVKQVIAVEKDDRLIPFLQEKFKHEIACGNFVLIHGDILELNPADHDLKSSQYKIVANIPYYITGVFLRKFLEAAAQPTTMVLMLQKEVAERIVARDGKESILSMSVKAYGEPKYIQTVKAGSFSPAPNVDSAILAIESISKKFFETVSEAEFFEILKAGFAGKRKTLKNNLRKLLKEKQQLPENVDQFFTDLFTKVGIIENARAETITLMQWHRLSETLSSSDNRNKA